MLFCHQVFCPTINFVFCFLGHFWCVSYDIRHANIFEALVGTLRATKKRKILTHEGELLLQGVHYIVEIILKPAPLPASGAATGSDVKN